MPQASKRTVNAKLIVQDIRAGLSESEIKEKFKLSDKGYKSVLLKLSSMGMLNEPGPEYQSPAPKAQPKLSERGLRIEWKCPACGAPQPRVYEECPNCGVIASKAAAIHSPAYRPHESYDYDQDEISRSLARKWPAVAVSLLVCLVLGAIILKWASPKRGTVTASTTAVGTIRNFTTSNFDHDVREASKTLPVLVVFYADW